ncbi:MAG: hypothetical protein HY582_05660 [Candidatus Omnitrophica bacterium]|nr:hypothetical protein [Candidatus Omnitrophota bacterium]
MKRKLGLFFVVIFTLTTISLLAAEPSPWTKELTYTKKTIGKLSFGIKNAAFGWTEFLMQPYSFMKANENFFIGIANGAFYAAADTTLGALQAGTFIFPKDIPLPEGNDVIKM